MEEEYSEYVGICSSDYEERHEFPIDIGTTFIQHIVHLIY